MIDLKLVIDEINLQKDIIDFLKNNPNPKDEQLHKWVEEKKYDVHKVEALIYRLATSYVIFLNGGRVAEKGITEKNVDPEELRAGVEVEKEHSNDPIIRKKIALDHIAEFMPKSYYKPLLGMEKAIKNGTI